MPYLLEDFVKKKDFLICIDSDGCAMDTMDSKHICCFGPSLIPIWGLESWKNEILDRWNNINLYTMTRGINRFLGLAMILKEIDEAYKTIPGTAEFAEWAEHAEELSASSVKEQWKKTGLSIFEQALKWSELVNKEIQKMPVEEKKAFAWVRESVEKAHEIADIAIVSSANRQAVFEEWKSQRLLEFADVLTSQDNGTKSDCIHTFLECGYEAKRVLMIGDAPGDYQAAKENGILFYPILVKNESVSWKQFLEKGLDRFGRETYAGTYQNERIAAFEENLQVK